MKTTTWVLALASVAGSVPGGAADRESWIGELRGGARATALRLELERTPEGVRGRAKALNPLSPLRNVEVTGTATGAEVKVQLALPDGALSLEGHEAEGTLSGRSSAADGREGSFRLLRALPADRARLREVEGIYEPAAGERLTILAMTQADGSLDAYALREPSGRFARLVATRPGHFVATASALEVFPADFELHVERDAQGAVRALELRAEGAAPRRAPRRPGLERREVTVKSGEVTLAGELLVPPSATLRAGVVLIHGSGPGERTQLAAMAWWFAARGLAVLSYDKRGCGGSSGDWKKADFAELAADARAAAAFLRQQPGVDPARVGFYGISQGGWVAPLAASLDPATAFVIAHSGPGVTPEEQDLFATANQLRGAGLDPKQVAKVTAAYRVLYGHVSGRLPAAALDAVAADLGKDGVLKEVAPPASAELADLAEAYRKQTVGDPGWYMHLDVEHDPLAVYRKVACPVLAVFGEHDWMVPVTRSAAEIERALAGNPRATVTVLAQAGHGLLATTGPGMLDLASPGRMAPGLAQTLDQFLTAAASARR